MHVPTIFPRSIQLAIALHASQQSSKGEGC
jgi:hypothetical protein